MDRLYETIGQRITQKRQELHLTQERLAAIVGLNRNYIGFVERAEKRVTLSTLDKIAKALNMPLETLFKGL